MKHLLTFFALLCVNNQLFSQSVARENEKQSLIRKINDIQKTPDNLLDPKKVAALNTQLEQSRGLFFNDNQTLDQLETSLKELSKRALPVAKK